MKAYAVSLGVRDWPERSGPAAAAAAGNDAPVAAAPRSLPPADASGMAVKSTSKFSVISM